MRRVSIRTTVALLLMPLVAEMASAQSATTGTIAGVVRDATGAVLPGVTVEASSPALIEKVRTAVSDGTGNYKIVDLRPGTYTVSFSLPGFSTVIREGLELNTGVAATVNAEMRVGAVEETVTVTGATPIVDVQNVRTQNVFTREVIDSVPSNKTIQAWTSMIVGAVGLSPTAQDVGGNQSEASASAIGIHGNRAGDMRLQQDGMNYNNFTSSTGSGAGRFLYVNQAAVEEMTLQTGGISAESESGGVQMNVVPKEGGNRFKVYFAGTASGPSLQNSNIDDELRARGVTTAAESSMYDWGGGVGGPIVKDRLWFYTAHRWWGNEQVVANNYFNKSQGIYIGAPDSGVARYEADLSNPAFLEKYQEDHSVRLTWQVSQRHKVNISHGFQDNCSCYSGVEGPISPEASYRNVFTPNSLTQLTWSYPATSRLLFEAGTTVIRNGISFTQESMGVSPDDISILELSTGYRYNSRQAGALGITSYNYAGRLHRSDQVNARVAASYVTGSHAFKVGTQVQFGQQTTQAEVNRAIDYTFRDGAPQSLRLWASPLTLTSDVTPNLGLYAQDQWTIRNLTLNLGVRFDYLHARVPAQTSDAGRFVPERTFGAVDNVPDWTDVEPRLGIAYDLFGNGKTAIKGSIGRYAISEAVSLAAAANPAASMVTSATRTWTDANGDYVPDCQLLLTAANGECGLMSEQAFGTVRITRRYDTEILEGMSVRPYNWQTAVSIQHELAPRFGVNVGYFRTWYGNFMATDNLPVVPANYSPYCVTAPTDSRLGSVSGTQLCSLYDINPPQFGLTDNFVTASDNFGKRTEVYNGIDITMSARFGAGGLLQGGFNTGRTDYDNCVEVDYPGQVLPGTNVQPPDHCQYSLPFEGQTNYKFSGVYPLPWWGLLASGTFQNLPGIPIAANRPYTNAEIAPSLGRNLAAGPAATATVSLLEPNTMFEKRLTQVDLRLTKIVRLRQLRLQGMFDVYNAFNANTVLALNTTYGSTWLRPTSILAGRLFKFGVQVDF